MKEQFDRIREICGGWGLYEPSASTEQMQILKAISEAGELADSIAKNNREQAKDDLGDILVCLINAYRLSGAKNNLEDQADFHGSDRSKILSFSYLAEDLASGIRGRMIYISACDHIVDLCNSFSLTINECLGQAISEIEKRKGRIINGVFVKDGSTDKVE